MTELLADWRRASTEIEALTTKLPRIIGHEAVKIVKDNFRIQGYDDGTGVKAWAPRSPKTNVRYNKRYGVKGTVYNSASPILKQTLNLYNSIKYYPDPKGVLIGVDLALVPYGKIHNEGGQGMAFGKYAFTMPKRQFMPLPGEPPNAKIYTAVRSKIIYERDQILKRFNL